MGSLRVLILGSGAGGLFLAKELSRAGCSVTLAHETPLAGFASTRNQGWLQAGALYAGTGQADVGRECKLASDELARMAPMAVDHGRRCFYLFDRQDVAELFAARNLAAGIDIRGPRSLSGVKALAGLNSRIYRYAVEGFDRPFNTVQVLRIIRNDALAAGCSFVHVADVETCVRRHTNHLWGLAGYPDEFDKVVVAAGAVSPSVLGHLGYQTHLKPMWITVLSVPGIDVRHMLLCPTRDLPNIVPYAGGLGIGFTVTLSQKDDWGFPDPNLIPGEAKLILSQLGKVLPDIERATRHSPQPAKPYWCTKLSSQTGQTNRRFIIDSLDASQSLWIFYPGKFTTAPLAARECARRVQGEPGGAIAVSSQPYP